MNDVAIAHIPVVVLFVALVVYGVLERRRLHKYMTAEPGINPHLSIYMKLHDHMQEQIDAQQRTIRFLSSRIDELEESRAIGYAEAESFRLEADCLREEINELRHGLSSLIEQLEAARIPPAWEPPPARKPSKPRKREKIDEVVLRENISDKFALSEIDDLLFRLGIDHELIPGSSKDAKIRGMIDYLSNRGRLGDLVELARSLRPDGGF